MTVSQPGSRCVRSVPLLSTESDEIWPSALTPRARRTAQIARLDFAPREPAVVELLLGVEHDERHDLVLQALLEHDSPTFPPIAILEGMNVLEAVVKIHDALERHLTLRTLLHSPIMNDLLDRKLNAPGRHRPATTDRSTLVDVASLIFAELVSLNAVGVVHHPHLCQMVEATLQTRCPLFAKSI